jgi:hypothetical protein
MAVQLPREPHNAPLHLFSASPELLGYAGGAYRQRSENTTALRQLFERFRGEGLTMPYTMKHFQREYAKEHFAQLTPQEQEEVLRSLPPERLDQLRQYLEQLSSERPAAAPKRRRKDKGGDEKGSSK